MYLNHFFMILFSDIVHRDLKLENILLSQPVGNELLNIKVGLRNVAMYLVTEILFSLVKFMVMPALHMEVECQEPGGWSC